MKFIGALLRTVIFILEKCEDGPYRRLEIQFGLAGFAEYRFQEIISLILNSIQFFISRNECYCSHTYPSRYTRISDSECKMTCVGSSSSHCGGVLTALVFSTGLPRKYRFLLIYIIFHLARAKYVTLDHPIGPVSE